MKYRYVFSVAGISDAFGRLFCSWRYLERLGLSRGSEIEAHGALRRLGSRDLFWGGAKSRKLRNLLRHHT